MSPARGKSGSNPPRSGTASAAASASNSRASTPGRSKPAEPAAHELQDIQEEDDDKKGPRRKKRTKKKAVIAAAPESADVADVPAAPKASFQPFRPMLTGIKVDISEDEDAEEGEVDEGVSLVYEVDDGPAPAAAPAPATPAPAPAPKPKEKEDDANASVLLLPGNVHVAESGDEEEDAVPEPMEGVHMVDDNNTRGAARYWMDTESDLAHFLAEADQSKVCRNCKKTGHMSHNCPHTICQTCGAEDQHARKDCPWSVICFGCGQRGHRRQECKEPSNRRFKGNGCERCGVWDHTANSCPSLWRVYVYRKAADRDRVMEEKEAAEGWKKQAIGGNPADRFCYNCAQNGHYGDDCQRQRGSLARAVVNSAFSENVAGRGPYALDAYVVRGGTHTRWDDELPYAAAGFKGAGAGAKSAQKAKQQHRQADRNSGRNDRRNDDRDDWFANRNSTPITGAPRGGWGSERRDRDRGSDDRDRYGRDEGRYGGRRGYDSERRRSRSPDRRGSNYNSQPPRISVGGSSLAARMGYTPHDSPSLALRRGQPTYTPQPAQPQPSKNRKSNSSRAKERDNRDRDRDRRDDGFEERWRASGAGGGNVASWGDDLAQRDNRDTRPKAGPVRGAKGQRYTGGY